MAAKQIAPGLYSIPLGAVNAFFLNIACFGHGKPILADAARSFRERWPAAS